MNDNILFVFLILLSGLILCTFLGGCSWFEGFETSSSSNNASATTTSSDSTSKTNNTPIGTQYDNYNHFEGTSYPTVFYGPNGGTARVIKTDNNSTIVVTNKNGSTEIYYIDNGITATASKYYGPNGGSAKMITDNNGKSAVEITSPTGTKVVYTGENAYTYNNYDSTINQYSPDTNKTGSDYNEAYTSQIDPTTYYNSLPKGIPRSQIPPGQEDLYILKSEVVPPVCPKCPEPIVKSSETVDTTKCPPCPPCARCPEPAFDCKKVPNYKSFNPDYMPVPVLSDFSGFGM